METVIKPARNLDLIVNGSTTNSTTGLTAREVGEAVHLFEYAEQMTDYEFEAYGTKISSNVVPDTVFVPAAARTTLALVREPTPTNLGQLAWRVGLVLAAINFVGLAIAAATSNPRAGRSGNMLFAAFAFFLVFQLLNLGQTWIASGKATFTGVTVGLHGITFVLVTLWLCK